MPATSRGADTLDVGDTLRGKAESLLGHDREGA
ncbi:hypothetical protein PF011_g32108 [Phytophthora fragariae]|uniref:Uncharacterized protein n=1 Tax=Phytophthora fragariae TaxID=53985 RepID=A0A6A3GA48_9STRA|nr:hypothetical protein PF011_g32108 [Phytophthora fragariae]